MKYIQKDAVIDAIQYKREENIHEVISFMEEVSEPVRKLRYQERLNEYALLVRLPNKLHHMHILEVGEYTIRKKGDYSVMSEAEFQKYFERVRF